MEHLIQEIFLVVPNLGLRVAEGQYDLCGPQDEILSPSNWGSLIEPGWEVTMRMWPNPERPPWEYAGPRAMLEDRHNIRAERQDEASHRLVSQLEGNELYDSENPRLGELRSYRSEEPTTQEVGGIDIEEQGPQGRSGLHRKRLSLVSGHSQDSDKSEGDHSKNAFYTHSENTRLREPTAHHRRKSTTDIVSDIIVEERRPRIYARPPRKYLSQRDHGSDSDEWDGEYTTLEDQKAQNEHLEPSQSRDLGPYQIGEQITERDPKKSLLPKGSLYEADMRERKRRIARGVDPTMGYETEDDDRYSYIALDAKPPEGNRKQKPLIVQERGTKARKQSANETNTLSDETQEKTAPRPFRKEAPFGPYHHYQGRG